MGILCIILGILFLVAFTGGGFMAVQILSKMNLMGQSALAFAGFKSMTSAYLVINGACFLIGLLLCITFVLLGSNRIRINNLLDRVAKLESTVRSLKKKNKKSSSKKSETEAIDPFDAADESEEN